MNCFFCRLHKRVLSFVHVPPPRGGHDIADAIYKCLKEWEIEEKIFTISVDNASYNDKALKRLKEIFSRVRKLVCGGRLFHVRCCAHILNLLVRDGLGTIDSVIGEVREAIKYVNNSEARLQRFSDYAHQLQIKDRKLVLDVPTRWNSTYDMLFVALKFKDVFPRYNSYTYINSLYKFLFECVIFIDLRSPILFLVICLLMKNGNMWSAYAKS